MAISLVAGQNPAQTATGTSITVTYATAPTQNNLLVVCLMMGSGFSAQSGPSGWTKDKELQRGTGHWVQTWSKIAGAGEPTGFTWSWTTSVTAHAVGLEATGNATSSYVDVSSSTDGGASNVTTLTVASPGTLAQATGLGVACIGLNGSSGGFLSTWTNSFAEFGSTSRLGVATKITSSTTGTNTNQTWTTARQAIGAIVHYKALSAATPAPSTIAAVVTVGTPTVISTSPDASPAPVTVAAIVTVPAVTVTSSGTTVQPTVIVAVTAMEVMGAELSATTDPVTVAAPVSMTAVAVTVDNPGGTAVLADGVTLSVQFSPTTRPMEAPVWFEIASLIREGTALTIRRGRSSELDRFQAGRCSFTLDNRSLMFDPSNSGGDFAGQLLPMRRVRVRATYQAVTYNLFTGFILGWPQSYDPSDNDCVVQVEAVDAFEVLENTTVEDNFLILDDPIFGRLDFNRLGGTDVTITEETAGGQLDTVLNIAGWPTGERDLDTGINLLEAGTLSGSVLSYCQTVEDSEDGFFFVAKNGDVTFLGRDARWLNTRLTTTQFTLSDDGADMPYSDVSLRYDRDYIYNDVTRTGSGEPQRAADSGSILEFGRRRDEKSGLVANDAGLRAIADYRVDRFKDPMVRPEPVRVPVRARVSQILDVLGAELLDRVVLERRPMGGTVRTFTGLLQSIELNISQVRFDATFTISPGDIDDTQYLILDDPVYGLLDTGILAY